MGLIKAAAASISGALGDTWKEFFYCDSLPNNVLVTKGHRKTGKNSSNKGDDNIITTGSVIVVNVGQGMFIVDQGKVVEVCMEPGEYTYDASTEPSIFVGGFKGIKDTFKNIGRRITFGGDIPHDQRIYFFNTKEIMDNKFGTNTPIPFRVDYPDLGRAFTVKLKCNGIYSYKIADPILFYTNVCGNVTENYTREMIDNTLYSEFMAQMQAFFSVISQTVRYDQIVQNNLAVTEAVKQVLKPEWLDRRGIEIGSVAIRSVSIDEKDEQEIRKYEGLAWNRDPANAAAKIVEAQNTAMNTAAGNANGAVMGFFGMNLANNAGGMNAQALFNMAAQQKAAAQQQMNISSSNASWTCSCGAQNTGKFCVECGKPKAADGWVCSCGAVNKGKFCAECGKPKPAGAPLYKCDKCGWEPEDPANPPKFCANCGDPFNDGDIVK